MQDRGHESLTPGHLPFYVWETGPGGMGHGKKQGVQQRAKGGPGLRIVAEDPLFRWEG